MLQHKWFQQNEENVQNWMWSLPLDIQLSAETDSLSLCIRKYSFVIHYSKLPLKSLRYYTPEKKSSNIQLKESTLILNIPGYGILCK